METPHFPSRLHPELTWRKTALIVLLLLGVIIRFYRIADPPDDFLSWRDTQTLMVARNFYAENMNVLEPRVDWLPAGAVPETGLVSKTELAVTPWLTALLYHLVGNHFWVGRVIPIIFAVLGIYWFFRFIERLTNSPTAFFAGLILTVSPYYLYCGRCQMPESFALAMSFGTLYYYDRWLEDGRWKTWAQALVLTVFMLVGKAPLGFMALPMACLTVQRHGLLASRTPDTRPALRDWRLYAFLAVTAAVFGAYYWWSFIELPQRTALTFGGSWLLKPSRWLTDPGYYAKITASVWNWSITPVVVLLSAAGLFFPPDRKRGYVLHLWMLGAISLFFAMPGGCETNGYYQIVLAPPAAALAAVSLGLLFRGGALRKSLAVVLVVPAVAMSLQVASRLFLPVHQIEYECGTWVRGNTAEDAIVVTANPSPATLYFADRRGWTSHPASATIPPAFNRAFIEECRNLGASVIAIPTPAFESPYINDYRELRDDLYSSFWSHTSETFTVFVTTKAPDLALPEGEPVNFGTPEARRYLRGTWSVDRALPQAEDDTARQYVSMGPAPHSSIVFTAQTPPEHITVTASAAIPHLVVTVKVNGKWLATQTLRATDELHHMELDLSGSPAGDGAYEISFDVARQDDRGRSLYLYSLSIQ